MPRKIEVSLGRIRELVAQGLKVSEVAAILGVTTRLVETRMNTNKIRSMRGKALRGPENGQWKGGRLLRGGDVMIWTPDRGHIAEHRLLMEQMLGRQLEPGEVVHHRDGNHTNNASDNLQVYRRNSEHLAEELKGRRPQWTSEGLRRMRIGILRSALRRRPASPKAPAWQRELDALLSPKTRRVRASLAPAWLRPLGTPKPKRIRTASRSRQPGRRDSQ